jgi:hypothetical protein
MRRVPLWIGVAVVAAGIGSAAALLHAREAVPLPAADARFLFVQPGPAARRVFLSFDTIAADVYWIRTIQHYGGDRHSLRTTGRFELLQPLLDLTTTLDPHFNLAYRFGAIFLAMDPPNGPGRPDQAIALLEKGLSVTPTRWQYAHDIAYVNYWYTGNALEAARWFEKAADMPGAPEWLRPLAATTRAAGGDRTGARLLLHEMANSDQAYIRQTAARSLAQLDALDAIDRLTAIVEQYHTRTGAYPRAWSDVVNAGLLAAPPVEPTSGAPFLYDAATHAVTLSPDSKLLPLPHLGRR